MKGGLDEAKDDIGILRCTLHVAMERVEGLEAREQRTAAAMLQLSEQTRNLLLAQEQLVDRVNGLEVARPTDDSPRGSRRDRPRSGSLPPILSCAHHVHGGNSDQSAGLDEHGMTLITTAGDAGPWWDHINSVLLWDKQVLSKELWAWLELNFARKRITVQHYFSKRVRNLIIRCTCCSDCFIMVYDSSLTKEAINGRIMELARFANCASEATVAGS